MEALFVDRGGAHDEGRVSGCTFFGYEGREREGRTRAGQVPRRAGPIRDLALVAGGGLRRLDLRLPGGAYLHPRISGRAPTHQDAKEGARPRSLPDTGGRRRRRTARGRGRGRSAVAGRDEPAG